jgi:hypothetical protein
MYRSKSETTEFVGAGFTPPGVDTNAIYPISGTTSPPIATVPSATSSDQLTASIFSNTPASAPPRIGPKTGTGA